MSDSHTAHADHGGDMAHDAEHRHGGTAAKALRPAAGPNAAEYHKGVHDIEVSAGAPC